MASVWGLRRSDAGNSLLRKQPLKWPCETDGFLACDFGEQNLRVAGHVDRIKHTGLGLARNVHMRESWAVWRDHRLGLFCRTLSVLQVGTHGEAGKDFRVTE